MNEYTTLITERDGGAVRLNLYNAATGEPIPAARLKGARWNASYTSDLSRSFASRQDAQAYIDTHIRPTGRLTEELYQHDRFN